MFLYDVTFIFILTTSHTRVLCFFPVLLVHSMHNKEHLLSLERKRQKQLLELTFIHKINLQEPLGYTGCPRRSYFCFSIYKAIRKVLFLEILDQRSYKGLSKFSKFWRSFCSEKILSFFEMAFRIKSAFHLFDKMLCKKCNVLI